MAWHVTIFEYLAQTAVAGCALLAIAACVLTVVRQPARRIRVIELTLVGLLAIPLLSLIPGYPRLVPWPVVDFSGGDEPAIDSGASVAQRVEIDRGDPPAEPGANELVREVPTDDTLAGPGVAVETLANVPAASIPPAMGPAIEPPHDESAGWWLPADVRWWVVAGYLGAGGVMIGWSLVGCAAVARLLRSARGAGGVCRAVLRDLAGPASGRVALLASARARQPCALVWWRPAIVLPEALAMGRDPWQLRFALAHEWSHVARRDTWSWALAGVVRWLYFYQPLLWPLRRDLRLCQDYLADAAAARLAPEAEDYAEFLTLCSTRLRRPHLAAGLGMAGGASDLQRRIVMLVNNRRELERAVPRRWNLAAFSLALLLVASVATLGLRPTAAVAEPAEVADEEDASDPAFTDAKREEVEEDLGPIGAQELEIVDALGEQVEVDDDMYFEESRLGPAIAGLAAIGHEQVEEVVVAPAPFSGRLRPGDILKIDLAGGFPDAPAGPRTATVEPDGNLALGVLYGRVQVDGKTLTEAEAIILNQLKDLLKDPRVQVTYDGHDPHIVAAGAPQAARPAGAARRAAGAVSARAARKAGAADRPADLEILEKMVRQGRLSQVELETRRLHEEAVRVVEDRVKQRYAEALERLAKELASQRREKARLEQKMADLLEQLEKQQSPKTVPSQR